MQTETRGIRREGWVRRLLIAWSLVIVVGASAALAPGGSALAGDRERGPATRAADRVAVSCLECHRNPTLSRTLPNGETLSLTVDEGEMAKSVHRGKLGCTDCHSRISDFPHKKLELGSRREYSIALYEVCKRCHFTNYARTLDSIHHKIMEAGNPEAPLCTDCHGYHNVSRPDEPRSRISRSCAACHRDTYQAYVESVHGAALLKEENRDVPVCTDCHGSHTIKDTDTASFRLDSPAMCARCHANEAMMRRYGLSPNVFKSYVQDFHGATVTLAKRQGPDNWTDKAVCSDCHGIHNITSVRGRNPAEIKRNVVGTCQKCHSDAGTNFPDAWLSHYDLSMEQAPLSYLVRTVYTIAIPLMTGGLMLHILVDLWRIARNR